MNCPHCATELLLTERKHIEIDYCPKCRGVWLDRGELDKLLESSGADHGRTHSDDDDRYHEKGQERNRSKRKSFLSEIFDF